MSAAGRKNERAPVRVVIISTQYIETDPASFKSVVQRLTGKDSQEYFDNTDEFPPPHPKRQLRRRCPPPTQSKVAPGCGEVIVGSVDANYMNSSISDLDRLLTELPSWNELSQLCID